MTAHRLLLGIAIAIVLAVLGPSTARAAETKIFVPEGTVRNFASVPNVHESIFTAKRGPSPFDRIALRHLTDGAPRSQKRRVVFYLPGTWMNGTIAPDDPGYSLGLFMASRDIDFWALDYRTHFVPASSTQNDLAELKDWTNELFIADIETAMRFIKEQTGSDRIILAGFSRGVSFAYLYAAQHPKDIAGLLLFDGYIGHGEKGTPPADIFAADVAGKHLTWDKREVLLKLVIASPHAPAPIAKYKDAADNLNHVVYDTAGFGGKGGLANPIDGFSDPSILARVLITYDRYWPIVQDYEDSFLPTVISALERSKISVLAFSSSNIAPDWPDRVGRSASSTGSSRTRVSTLKGWGHLDVICGTYAARDVFAPALQWIKQLPE